MTTLLASLLLAPASLPPEIEDEQALGVNKLPYHSTLVPYKNLQEALRADRTKSSYARSLNGDWKFHYVPRPEMRPVDFYKPSYDVSKWDTIHVPSNWQVKGYGTPYYRNIGYTFKQNWPYVMTEPPKDWTAYEERNPVGSYRRTFEIPMAWDGRQTFLKFDGVDAGFFLWINGVKVGYSQNSRNAAEFDITKYLKPGKNDIAVEVYRYTAGSYFEDQDMWRLSGIFRNVTLWSAPKLHVQDTFVTTDLDPSYSDAKLKVVAKVHNYGDRPSAAQSLTAVLYDASGKPVKGVSPRGPVPSVPAGGEATVTLEATVAKPMKWSAETPHLYTVVVGLGDELLSHRVGFRKVEIKGRVFMVNGQPVKLKGANRHEMSPETGHYVTEADMVRDLEMLKKANCNHVRTSHYSNDPRWYELCDEWGIYLVAEANVECHGYGGVLDREPRFERMIVDRNVANVENFKNHASVVIWSMGNECGGGPNLRSAERTVRAMDSTRPTHYEAFGEGAGNPAGIDSHMYTDPESLERIANNQTLTKPMYLCEYAHAMNNSMGSIGDYNDLFDKYPALMGGAIWEWEDQGLWNRRDPKRQYLAYGGGFGEVPNDGHFIHKGVVFSDRSPKPHFPEVKRAYQWIAFRDLGKGRIAVKNRFAFTNLDEYTFRWTVVSDSGVVATGMIPSFTLAPGEETTLTLNLPAIKVKAGTSLYVNLAATLKKDEKWAAKGYEIANAQFPLNAGTVATEVAAQGALEIKDLERGLTVIGSGFEVSFDQATGTISKLARNGVNVLLPGGGPKLHLWRAQHRKDDNWAAGGWETAGLRQMNTEMLDLVAYKQPTGEVTVSSNVRYVGKNGFSALHLARFTIYPDGTIAVDNGVSPAGSNIALARVGVRMLLDPKLQSLTYFARGPFENYSDRKRGSDLGRYVSSVPDQLTPYPKPQECGNHEDLKWLNLAGKGTPSLVAMADREPLQFSALPYQDEEMEDVHYNVDLPKSKATVLILSGKTLGVGSAACGPRPLPQYRLDCTPRRFSYVLRLGASTGPLSVPKRDGEPILVQRALDGKTALLADEPIQTSTNGGQNWEAYREPLTVGARTEFWVRAGSYLGKIVVEPPPAKLAWRASASDFEPGEGDPAHTLDNDPTTFWHSRYSPSPVGPPHALTVDLIKPTTISRVILTPRQDGRNGRIRGYEILASDDGQIWSAPLAKGDLADREDPQTIRLPDSKRTRYLRLVVLSDWSNEGWATLGEFDAR